VKAKFVDINHDEGTIYASQIIFKGTAKYMYKNTPFFLCCPVEFATSTLIQLPTTLFNAIAWSQRKAKYIDQCVSHNHATLYSHFILETKLRKIKRMKPVLPRQHSSLTSYL